MSLLSDIQSKLKQVGEAVARGPRGGRGGMGRGPMGGGHGRGFMGPGGRGRFIGRRGPMGGGMGRGFYYYDDIWPLVVNDAIPSQFYCQQCGGIRTDEETAKKLSVKLGQSVKICSCPGKTDTAEALTVDQKRKNVLQSLKRIYQQLKEEKDPHKKAALQAIIDRVENKYISVSAVDEACAVVWDNPYESFDTFVAKNKFLHPTTRKHVSYNQLPQLTRKLVQDKWKKESGDALRKHIAETATKVAALTEAGFVDQQRKSIIQKIMQLYQQVEKMESTIPPNPRKEEADRKHLMSEIAKLEKVLESIPAVDEAKAHCGSCGIASDDAEAAKTVPSKNAAPAGITDAAKKLWETHVWPKYGKNIKSAGRDKWWRAASKILQLSAKKRGIEVYAETEITAHCGSCPGDAEAATDYKCPHCGHKGSRDMVLIPSRDEPGSQATCKKCGKRAKEVSFWQIKPREASATVEAITAKTGKQVLCSEKFGPFKLEFVEKFANGIEHYNVRYLKSLYPEGFTVDTSKKIINKLFIRSRNKYPLTVKMMKKFKTAAQELGYIVTVLGNV